MEKITINDFITIDESEKENIILFEKEIVDGFNHSFYIVANADITKIDFRVIVTTIKDGIVIWSDSKDSTTLTYCINYVNTFIEGSTKTIGEHVSDLVLV